MINVSHYINYKNIIVLHYDSILLITIRKWAWALEKPEKIYLNNPNQIYAISSKGKENTGTIRETFFINMLSIPHKVSMPQKGDFYVDNKYTFEIGGKKKSFKQIKDINNSFLAIDDVETGIGNKIPLWLFGFLY